MSNANCRVYNTIERPDRELVEKFRGVPVANIDDCIGRQAAVDSSIKAVGRPAIIGTAITVKVPQGGNLMFHYALDLAQEGDVFVIDAGGYTDRSIFGDIIVSYLEKKKIAGIIVDGAIRDVADIAKSSIPVYCKGVSPNGPWKNGPGEVNTPICCGGKTVFPGDIVVADEDGVLFIRPAEAEELYKKVQNIMAMEGKSLKAIAETGEMNRPWVMEKLIALNCEFND